MEMGPEDKGLSRAYIHRAVERSLKRLQTDTIDLYQAHQDDPHTPLEETLEAFGQLQQQGKVRVVGASNYSAERLKQALEIGRFPGFARYECLQPWYNLVERQRFEAELEPVCVSERLSVIPYYSLASGFLSGKYRTEADLAKSKRGPSVKKYLDGRGFGILVALDEIAMRHGTSPAAVALAWLMARPSVTAPIASATTLEQLSELTAAAHLRLDAEALEQLNLVSQW